MTTDPHDDEFGEILRRALRAEAETVAPSTDSLEQIRTRIAERRRSRFSWSWLTLSWTRPALVAAAIAAVALVGVGAPVTINRITSAGDNGSTAQGQPTPRQSTTEPSTTPDDESEKSDNHGKQPVNPSASGDVKESPSLDPSEEGCGDAPPEVTVPTVGTPPTPPPGIKETCEEPTEDPDPSPSETPPTQPEDPGSPTTQPSSNPDPSSSPPAG